MQLSEWFTKQLQSSTDGLVWSAEQVPAERHFRQPPANLGQWSVARHLFHMVDYEQKFALPLMRQWLGEAAPVFVYDEEDAWQRVQAESLAPLVAQFRAVRNEQLALLPLFKENTWYKVRKTFEDEETATLLWVVTKTYQHTAAHTNDLLRIALFWDLSLTLMQADGTNA
jgi:hypothetical protein